MASVSSRETIANAANCDYILAVGLKRRGHHKQALEYFKKCAERYELLADQNNITSEAKLNYLAMQKECLENMLADSLLHDVAFWARTMLKLKEVYEYIEVMK
jgi:hypothetical protein